VGYRIKALPYKKRTWKVQTETYVGGERKILDLALEEYTRAGFDPKWPIERAKEHQQALNAQSQVKAIAEKRAVIRERLDDEALVRKAFLGDALVEEFEDTILYARLEIEDRDTTRAKKLRSHWAAAQITLCEIKLPPIDWASQATRFYDYFVKHRFSPSYVQKVMRVINMWGGFVSRRSRQYWEPIPSPRGREKHRISDRYFSDGERGKESDPISPEMLESARSGLKPEQFNWVYLTIWLGLRPEEVDQIHKKGHHEILFDRELGKNVVRVYQPKLVGIRKEDRFKFIPVTCPEQDVAVKLLQSAAPLERPLVKTLRAHVEGHVGVYGGRKGFEQLMLARGHQFSDISSWLGHQTVDRTWRSYRNRKSARYSKAA
jgi:hypothetical protein